MSRRRGAHTDFSKVLVADLLQWPVDACWCSPKARIHHELQAVGDSLSWAGHRRCDAMVTAAAMFSSGHCRVCRVGPGQCCFCLSAMDVCLMLVPATTNICNICLCLKMVHSLTLHNFKILVDQNRSNWWFLASLTGQTDKWWYTTILLCNYFKTGPYCIFNRCEPSQFGTKTEQFVLHGPWGWGSPRLEGLQLRCGRNGWEVLRVVIPQIFAASYPTEVVVRWMAPHPSSFHQAGNTEGSRIPIFDVEYEVKPPFWIKAPFWMFFPESYCWPSLTTWLDWGHNQVLGEEILKGFEVVVPWPKSSFCQKWLSCDVGLAVVRYNLFLLSPGMWHTVTEQLAWCSQAE